MYFINILVHKNLSKTTSHLPHNSTRSDRRRPGSSPRTPWHYRSDRPRRTWPNKRRPATFQWFSVARALPKDWKKYCVLIWLKSSRFCCLFNAIPSTNPYHITLLRIGHHALQLIANALLGQASGKFFAGARLRSVKHDQTTARRLQLLDEGVVGHLHCADRRGSVGQLKLGHKIKSSRFFRDN